MIDLVILIACNVANLMLGLSIYLRNPNKVVNRIFALLSFSIITWTTLNFLADNTPLDLSLWFTRLTFVGGILISFSILCLSRYFPNEKVLHGSLINKLQVSAALVVALLSLTPWLVSSVSAGQIGIELSEGPLYTVYILYIVQAFMVMIYNFRVQFKTRASALQRNQLRLILIGLLLYALFAIGANLLLPLITDSWASSRFGPIFSLFLVLITGYTIIRHRLFDVKLAIARSIAYIAALAAFAALYGVMIFSVTRFVFGVELSVLAQILLSVITGFAALFFYPLKHSFDRITNRLFYRDAYDPQEFFNSLNQALVSSASLDNLLDSTSKVITDYLKAEFCFVEVKDEDGKIYHKDTKDEQKVSAPLVQEVEKHIPLGKSVIITDELGVEHPKLKKALLKGNVSVLIHLSTNYNNVQQDLGYVLLGPKKSGNPYNTRDVKVMETAANELIVAIQNALRFEEIRSFNRTLQIKVDEATAQLKKTNTELQRLDEAKDEFVSMASHQLRTPLTSVKGYISMVLEGDVGKITASQRQLLSEAYTSSERMVHLINDFLNVSRLQTGKFMLEEHPVDLSKIVAQEVESLQTTAKARNLKLLYRKPSYFPVLYVDEGKIRQVLMNFIDNAIYYSHEDTSITVKLEIVDGDAVLTVRDTGIGVPQSEQNHLFSKFFRATNARKQRPDGTGVGLFLAKKVILAHGGSMVVDSKEGQGSTFGFRLPVKKLSAPRDDTHKLD